MKNNLVQQNIPSGWQSTSVDDICYVMKGQGLSKKDIDPSGKNKCILYGELFTTYDEVIKDVKSRTDSTVGTPSVSGDVLIPGSTTTVARDLAIASALNEDGVLLGGDINILRRKDSFYDANFLAYYLTHYKKDEIGKLGQGTTIVHLYGSNIKALEVILPKNIREQQKIAEVLGTVDEDIAKTQEVIEATEKLKRGLMQDIFSFKNKKDVKYLALGNIGKVSMCKRVFKEETSNTGEIPFYKIGTFGKEPDAFISQKLFDSYRRKFSFPKIGDILLSASGTIGRKVKYDGKPAYFQDSNIIWLEHDGSKILNDFLFYLYDTIKWQTEGSTIKRLYNDILLKKVVPVPSIDQQKRIVEVLSVIDEKISVNKKLKEKLTLLKRGLMQDLLSGKKRII
ncbi:MAG: restriction endonuclease subunit S [Candidatus Colwellbacteria bacterium]|nr:restriction endonuclease subunit S [Candidatus Colwellbacteria bacterium]